MGAFMNWIFRIFKSLFALPPWVIVWMLVFLIPINMSGYFLLEYDTGWWVAALGGSAIILNMVLVLINGGFSKVLAIPHVVFWLPLELILIVHWMNAPAMGSFEQTYLVIVLLINGISLGFDLYDTRQWWRGNRKIAGYESETPAV